MFSHQMEILGRNRSVIRDLFEYGNARAAEIGRENVFDFSIGNPSVPAPCVVNETISRLVRTEDSVRLHGYTSAAGAADVRTSIADYLNRTFGTSVTAENLYLTAGAAASLCISLTALMQPEDEVIAFAPFFPEYRVFVEKAGGKFVPVLCRQEDFQIDFAVLEAALTPHTKAVLVNSPNNPSGAVLSEETIRQFCRMLENAQLRFGHAIYLIADEPYRELVYGTVSVPYIPCFYDNTIVCYSFSKSLSLPGERIGYVLVSDRAEDSAGLCAAVAGAGRALGYVCAPSLFQRVLPECLGMTSDLSVYTKNRDLLYDALTDYGYHAVPPDGAFYLFVKALEKDAKAFSEKAKQHELLLVPSDSFGFPGYVRIAYCVSTEQIIRSLPAFKQLAQEYGIR